MLVLQIDRECTSLFTVYIFICHFTIYTLVHQQLNGEIYNDSYTYISNYNKHDYIMAEASHPFYLFL